MNREDIMRWLSEGSIIYYFYLSGGIAISHPEIKDYEGVQWLSYDIFSWLKKEGIIDMTGKGNYTLIRGEKYQSYTLVGQEEK